MENTVPNDDTTKQLKYILVQFLLFIFSLNIMKMHI